jgi:predicted MFS family arabinose efflux permease
MGQVLRVGGSWMQLVAMSWMAYRLADSAFILALVQFLSLLPVGLVTLAGGVISDRFPPRGLVLGTQIVLVIQALILAGLAWTGAARLWHVMLMTFVVGAADAIEQPARYVIAIKLVGQEGLGNAISLYTLAESVARSLAPAVAGALIGWQGEAGSYAVNGLAYLLAGLVFTALPQFGTRPSNRRPSLQADLLAAPRYLWSNGTARALLLLLSASCLLAQPYVILMPVWARESLQADARGYGLLMSAIGIGAACGALIAASIHSRRRGRWLIGASMAFCTFLVLAALSHRLSLTAGLLLLAGAGQSIQLVLISSLLQRISRSDLHGRVASLYALLSNGLTRLGGVQAGWVASHWGAPLAVAGGALISILWSLVVAWQAPTLRRLE